MSNSISGIRIKYKDPFEARYQARNDLAILRESSDQAITASTWQQNYGTLFQAVQNERFLVAFMLFMLIILSAYNLMSMLVMTVNEKRSQIAILMTMGATSLKIRNLFLFFGSFSWFVGNFYRYYFWPFNFI